MGQSTWRGKLERQGAKEWTVMVYMVAGNDAELDAVAVRDLQEMERGIRANPSVHVVVQINRHWPSAAQRYVIRSPEHGSTRTTELLDTDTVATNMARQETLAEFLTWTAETFPATHYCLILWGHAYGLGFGRDHDQALTLGNLKGALKEFQGARLKADALNPAATAPQARGRTQAERSRAATRAGTATKNGTKLELLGANACAMSYIEAAYELRKHVQYMVASQISVPYAGWPFTSILGGIGPDTLPKALGQSVVDAYFRHFNNSLRGEQVAMSLLDLEVLSAKHSLPHDAEHPHASTSESYDLAELLASFAGEIVEETRTPHGSDADGFGYVTDAFMATAAGDVRPLIDLRDLCGAFGDAESSKLRRLAGAVDAAVKRLVIAHRGHATLGELRGVGIFAPFVTDDRDLERLELLDESAHARDDSKDRGTAKEPAGQQQYKELSIFVNGYKHGDWPGLVYDKLRHELPSEVVTCLAGIACSRQDRRDIAQILLAVDSAFNKLDRVLASAKRCVEEKLSSAKPAETGAVPARPSDARAALFAPPRLKLIRPVDLGTQLERLQRRVEFERLSEAIHKSPGVSAYRGGDGGTKSADGVAELAQARPGTTEKGPDVVEELVAFFERLETAVGDVERAVRNGLTNARFGLGPNAPTHFSVAEEPKSGHGSGAEEPKSGHGPQAEEPKSGHGQASSALSSAEIRASDLRVDLALERVVDLFRQVGQALQDLELRTRDVEMTARAFLTDAETHGLTEQNVLGTAGYEIERGFLILEEASAKARRTVRRVLSHPVYGLAPSSGGFGSEERQTLATAGGLTKANLQLL